MLLTLSMCCLLDGWLEKTAFIASRVGIIGVFRKLHTLHFDGRRRRCHLRSGVRNRHYLELSIFGVFRGGEKGIGKRHAHADCGGLSNDGGITAVRVTVCGEM